MARPKITNGPRLPAFASDADERKFWETHSPSEYLAQMRPMRVEVRGSFRARAKVRKRRGTARTK